MRTNKERLKGSFLTCNFDSAGRMIGHNQFNGSTVEYSYDNADRLPGLENRAPDAGLINSLAFVLDDNGNRNQATHGTQVAPDLVPARAAYTYNANGTRLETADAVSFGYDDEGQQIAKGIDNYTFDPLHRLAGISGAADYHYFYDGANNRIKAVRNGVATKYIYGASGNLLAQANENNVITRYYIYGGTGLLAMVTAEGDIYCYHYDVNGNTTAITNAAGTVVNTYEYLPFGEIAAKTETISQPFTFVGRYGVMAEPSGIYYMRARYYIRNLAGSSPRIPWGLTAGM